MEIGKGIYMILIVLAVIAVVAVIVALLTVAVHMKSRADNEMMLGAIRDYEYICKLDLNTRKEYVYFTSDAYSSFAKGDDYHQKLEEFAKKYVLPEDMNKFREGIQQDRILKELRNNAAYYLDYRIFENGKTVYFQTKCTLTADRRSLIIGFYNVDINMRRELALEAEVQNQRISGELLDQTVLALATSIDAKDKYTNGHSLRVAQYVLMLADRMGLDEKRKRKLKYMAMLHDIGKIGITDRIITKSGSLADDEYETVKEHTIVGAEILEKITVMPDLYQGARWHHERIDGTGYPDGLRGQDIPEDVRIIAVADAYDAMTSNRIYRKMLPQSVVRQRLVDGRGTQFDSGIADIMIRIIDEDAEYRLHQ